MTHKTHLFSLFERCNILWVVKKLWNSIYLPQPEKNIQTFMVKTFLCDYQVRNRETPDSKCIKWLWRQFSYCKWICFPCLQGIKCDWTESWPCCDIDRTGVVCAGGLFYCSVRLKRYADLGIGSFVVDSSLGIDWSCIVLLVFLFSLYFLNHNKFCLPFLITSVAIERPFCVLGWISKGHKGDISWIREHRLLRA